jgi:hypothetical protein
MGSQDTARSLDGARHWLLLFVERMTRSPPRECDDPGEQIGARLAQGEFRAYARSLVLAIT